MDSLARPRLNHYELLGLTPAASDEEIRLAFAREIGPHRPRPLGGTAAISVAFATLRDPVRRRDYDVSLGLTPKPAPAPRLDGWQFTGPVLVSRPSQPGIDPLPGDELHSGRNAQPEPEPHPEPFIAEPAQIAEEPEPHVEAEAPRRPDTRPDPRPAGPVPIAMRILPMEEAPSSWKRPALWVGGLFLAVALLGVLAGLWASRDVAAQEQAVTFPAAPAEAEAAAIVPPAAAQAAPARVARVTPPPVAARQARQASPAPQPILLEEQRAEDVPEIPAEQVAALTSQAAEAKAELPIADAAVARTISRIGYSCGEVASTSAVEGSSGVFKITCTSGQAFKASPVRGRYRFRRWAE